MVQVGADGCLSYPEDADKNRIPDFSYAGYKNGSVDLPDVPVKVTLSPIAGDNTSHIQNAIDQVGAMSMGADGFRGAVLLQAGTYEIQGTLKINKSGVVLKGTGDGADPSTNTLLKATGNSPAQRDVLVLGGGDETNWRGQVSGTKTNITTPFVQVGAFSFEVEDATKYQVGDNIIIFHPGSQQWVDALGGGGSPTGSWEANKWNILYNRFIQAINGKTITIDAPVYNHLDKYLSQSYIYKYDRAGLVTNVGIENLRVDIEHTGELENHAKNAIVFKQVENGWAKHCTVLHFILAGFRTTTASLITIDSCKAIEPKSQVVPSRRYNFNVEASSNNILIKNCYANLGRHAYTSNGTTSVSGLVIYNCVSEDPFTSSEGHRHWTTGMLFDNWKDYGTIPSDGGGRVLGLYNRGDWGSDHGWSNAHSVAWNCDLRRSGGEGKAVIQKPPTAQNYAIGGFGDFTGNGPKSGPAGHIEGIGQSGLQPQSLYLAQLNCRIGQKTCQEVSASSHDGNVPQNVLDQNFGTRWSAEGDGQYLQFCLGGDSTWINSIEIAFYKGDERQSIFSIWGSKDGQNWDTLISWQSSSGSNLGYELFDLPNRYYKYLRYIGHGNSMNAWNSVTELKIDSNVVTSIDEETSLIQVYPNPTHGSVQISSSESIQQVSVFDLRGSLIDLWKGDELQSHLQLPSSGVYLFHIQLTSGKTQLTKVSMY